MIILVVAAFVAGYLIGRAGPPIIAAEDDFLVTRVIDGDTLEMADGSLVGYLCIDAPAAGEPLYDGRPSAPAACPRQGGGTRVGLMGVDQSGRQLRYVYVDGALVTPCSWGKGWARIAVLDEDELHAELLRDLEAQAREKGEAYGRRSCSDRAAGGHPALSEDMSAWWSGLRRRQWIIIVMMPSRLHLLLCSGSMSVARVTRVCADNASRAIASRALPGRLAPRVRPRTPPGESERDGCGRVSACGSHARGRRA